MFDDYDFNILFFYDLFLEVYSYFDWFFFVVVNFVVEICFDYVDFKIFLFLIEN